MTGCALILLSTGAALAGPAPPAAPLSVKGGRFLTLIAEEEGIHVCQGTIWSQYGIDNGDGDGSISYPYFPSREHACNPSRSWSLSNRINQKHRRPEDGPVPLNALTGEEQALIRKHYPELFCGKTGLI